HSLVSCEYQTRWLPPLNFPRHRPASKVKRNPHRQIYFAIILSFSPPNVRNIRRRNLFQVTSSSVSTEVGFFFLITACACAKEAHCQDINVPASAFRVTVTSALVANENNAAVMKRFQLTSRSLILSIPNKDAPTSRTQHRFHITTSIWHTSVESGET
ncbi:hypothetical protein KUCAC02_029619, partial [Chaenocephalus aceratus]